MNKYELLDEEGRCLRNEMALLQYPGAISDLVLAQELSDELLAYHMLVEAYLLGLYEGVPFNFLKEVAEKLYVPPPSSFLNTLIDNYNSFNPIFFLYYNQEQSEKFLINKIDDEYVSIVKDCSEGKNWQDKLWNQWIVQSFTEQITCILLLRYCLSIESEFTPKILEIYSDLEKVNKKATQKRCDREGDILLSALLTILREGAISDESLQIAERALGMAVRRDAFREVSMISKDVVMIVAWLLLNDQKKLNTFTDIFPYIHGLADKVQIKSEHTGKIL